MTNSHPQHQSKVRSTQPALSAKGSGNRPNWILILGAVFAGLTLAFFMFLVIIAIFGHIVPSNARFLVIVVLALGAAMSAGFLGGAAAIQGKIPIPFVQKHPLVFSAGGGIAFFLIVLLLGCYLYVNPATRQHYVVIPLPGNIPIEFKIENLSTQQIADIGKVRTIGNNHFLYVEFRRNEDNGFVRLMYPKTPGPGFETSKIRVQLNGEHTLIIKELKDE